MRYLEEQNLCAMNRFFKKKPKRMWTCIAPNLITKDEIDYILSSSRPILRDVT